MTALRSRAALVALAVVVGSVGAADEPNALKSGPQVGAKISKSFDVRICNGPDAGDTLCLV
jgi:hypothetical protein